MGVKDSKKYVHLVNFKLLHFLQLYEDHAFFRNSNLSAFLSHILKALDDISVPVDPAMKKTLEQHHVFS